VPFDVSFQVGSEVVSAHQCMLEARKFSLIESREIRDGQSVWIDEPPYTNKQFLLEAVKACYGIPPEAHSEISISVDVQHIIDDLHKLDPNSNSSTPSEGFKSFVPDESEKSLYVNIIGTSSTITDRKAEWSLWAHKAILSAHSEYFRSMFGWNKCDEERNNDVNVVHLDSEQFTCKTIQELISSCYGNPISLQRMQSYWNNELLLQLIRGASYLMMPVASICHEATLATRINLQNVLEFLTLAEDYGAHLLESQCYKYLCNHLTNPNIKLEWALYKFEWMDKEQEALKKESSLRKQIKRTLSKAIKKKSNNTPSEEKVISLHPALQLQFHQLRIVLESNCIETQESELLRIVLIWSSITKASKESTQELVKLIRLPFVPVDSFVMRLAIEADLVSADRFRISRLFQTNTEHRTAILDKESMSYCPRSSTEIKSELHRKMWSLELHEDMFPRIRMGF
jgi:hypothetical protein